MSGSRILSFYQIGKMKKQLRQACEIRRNQESSRVPGHKDKGIVRSARSRHIAIGDCRDRLKPKTARKLQRPRVREEGWNVGSGAPDAVTMKSSSAHPSMGQQIRGTFSTIVDLAIGHPLPLRSDSWILRGGMFVATRGW